MYIGRQDPDVCWLHWGTLFLIGQRHTEFGQTDKHQTGALCFLALDANSVANFIVLYSLAHALKL